MIELVVLDLAGTTVHDGDAVGGSFRGALAAAGVVPETAAVTAVMGLPKPEAVRLLLQAAGRSPSDDEVAALHADFVRRMVEHYATGPDVREVPGAAAAIAELRAMGVKVALNTGFSRDITDVLLGRLGWLPPAGCDAVICSDEVPRGRPHPDMIRALMARLGVSDAARVAKAGDTAADLGEGTSAGCGLVVGVTSGSHTADELRIHPHTHLLASVAEVPALVRRANGVG